MKGALRARAVLVLSLFCLAGAAHAQATARWLASAGEASAYAAVAPRLIAFSETVAAAGVDERLYLDRLIEGVRKRAPAERVVQAMEEEAGRLVFLAKELDASGIRMNADARGRALAEGSLFLRASGSREEFALVVKRIAAEGESADRATATVSALASADPARVVGPGLRLELAAAIAGSSVRTDRLDSIAAVFARGRSFGLSPDGIARIVVAELAAGGSLAAVDAALNRERRTR
jgi:hypothetical protein